MAQAVTRRVAIVWTGIIGLLGVLFLGAKRLMRPVGRRTGQRGQNMEEMRSIVNIINSRPTREGAGVRLNRVFGFGSIDLDPFLLMDHFGSNDPDDYVAGFPWHPHRGMETITYVLEGEVTHEDSLGNKGTIYPGDIQWMTAGSGIIHQEMPRGDKDNRMSGIQLWANLPKEKKMTPPNYRDVKSTDIPRVELENGIVVRIIAGELNGKRGPVEEVAIGPEYLDIAIPARESFVHPTPMDHTLLAYILEGSVIFESKEKREQVSQRQLAHFSTGSAVHVTTGAIGARLLLVSGEPLKEPVAWQGPIVMNTDAELRQAFKEIRDGTFIKR